MVFIVLFWLLDAGCTEIIWIYCPITLYRPIEFQIVDFLLVVVRFVAPNGEHVFAIPILHSQWLLAIFWAFVYPWCYTSHLYETQHSRIFCWWTQLSRQIIINSGRSKSNKNNKYVIGRFGLLEIIAPLHWVW